MSLSYEERYGSAVAKKLRKIRSRDAIKQFKDKSQRDSRKITSSVKRSKQVKQKLSEIMTVHGGNTYRERALKHYGLECRRCGFSSKHKKHFHVHHKDGLNVNVELADHSLNNLRVLCRSCHKKLHNELSNHDKKFFGIKSIEKGVLLIFKGLKQAYNLNLADGNFKETPHRVARAYAEIFEGASNTDTQVKEILSTGFPCESSNMVIVKDIRAFSMCPHHLLPVDYQITVAYLPSKKKKGSVLGLSKLARLVEVLARRPVIQEQLVGDITKALMKLKKCRGAACIAKGKHYCMMMRGVKQPDSVTETSSVSGVFMDNEKLRAEFLELARS